MKSIVIHGKTFTICSTIHKSYSTACAYDFQSAKFKIHFNVRTMYFNRITFICDSSEHRNSQHRNISKKKYTLFEFLSRYIYNAIFHYVYIQFTHMIVEQLDVHSLSITQIKIKTQRDILFWWVFAWNPLCTIRQMFCIIKQ